MSFFAVLGPMPGMACSTDKSKLSIASCNLITGIAVILNAVLGPTPLIFTKRR